MLISFVIPCYGSENTIENVINEINSTMSIRSEYNHEIILVNDSSPDKFLIKAKMLCDKYQNIKVIDFASNFGQHSALMAGYSVVKGDIIVSLDDDGQTPANELFKLLDKLNEGYDVVFAKYINKKHSSFRNFGSYINDIMARILINKPKNLYLSSYFVAKSFVIKEMLKYTNPYPYISGLILRTTNKIGNVVINHRDRDIGASGYNLKKLLRLWMNGFTAFSVKPLRVSMIIGFIFAIIGFIFGCYALVNKFINPLAPIGWTSIIGVLTLIGGLILIMLGMIGEYIGRIYISINNSPQYVIRKTINIESENYIYNEYE